MFVLAHLSDPHLGPLPPPRLSELASKRALGFVNWQRKRRFLHRADVLDALVRDLTAQAPDHIAVTGDLVNISLPGEFATARAWLERLGTAHDVTLVPGNHDVYVRAARDEPAHSWGDYMGWDSTASAPGAQGSAFPFVRRRGPVALIGLSTALPTPPFMATGRLGPEQIERLADILAVLGRENRFRVVLIHHPPLSKPARRLKRLVDAEPFRDVLARHGAELVVHGHDHVHAVAWLDGPTGKIPAVSVPSASAVLTTEDDPAAYNLYRIDRVAGGWRCEMISRGLAESNASTSATGIVALKRRVLIGDATD
jgi:3',5'-cyclic AMP phosphodiesterase CpdA